MSRRKCREEFGDCIHRFSIVLLLLVAAFRAQKVIKVGVWVTAPFLRIGKPDVMERENSAFKDGKPGAGGRRAGLLGKWTVVSGKKQKAFAPKDGYIFRKYLYVFKISPNVFTHISCCSGILLLKCPIPLRLLVAKRALGGDKKLLLLRFAFSTGLLLCLSASYCMVIVRLAAKRIIGWLRVGRFFLRSFPSARKTEM